MGKPPGGVVLTPAGYILLDGTPYDPVKRKQENERRKAAKRKKQPKQQEAAHSKLNTLLQTVCRPPNG